jgi:hypothetical protein
MTDAARLRAQKAHSTDPEYLERMAREEEARENQPALRQRAGRDAADAQEASRQARTARI